MERVVEQGETNGKSCGTGRNQWKDTCLPGKGDDSNILRWRGNGGNKGLDTPGLTVDWWESIRLGGVIANQRRWRQRNTFYFSASNMGGGKRGEIVIIF
jgi:hypothetical protein